MPRKYVKRGLNRVEKKQTKQIVQKVLNSNVEQKSYYHPRVTNVEFTTTAPYLTDFLNVPQGTQDWQRVGDEILFNHLKVNIDLTGSTDGLVKSGLPVDRVRLILVKWREPDYVSGSVNQPSALDLFGGYLPVGTNIYTSMINHEENKRRFKVLYDKKITLSGQATSAHVNSPECKQKFVSINIPMKKYGHKKIKYDSIDTFNNIHMNGLYLFALTDNPGGATQSGPTISMDARLLFREV